MKFTYMYFFIYYLYDIIVACVTYSLLCSFYTIKYLSMYDFFIIFS